MSAPSAVLRTAHALANAGRFDAFRATCQQIVEADCVTPSTLLEVAALLSSFGFLSDAQTLLEQAQAQQPDDPTPLANLANVARDVGQHALSRQWYTRLVQQLPHHPVIRRNALTGLEYDPEVPNEDRLAQAQAWGDWAMARAGGARPRPPLTSLSNRALHLGYVSADLCQHTVGLFVKDVLKAHDRSRVQVFAYSAGQVKDWVTDEIRATCTLRDVATLNDAELATQIRADGIDVLIDLSGHTAGSRLTAFAYRPAPVMVSWLGYFATTGLPAIDAVLLDDWHAPPGTEAQFVEPLVRLPGGRFCYTPPGWLPAVAPAPTFANGHITFGCFNNTAKLNADVFDRWAEILRQVPDSRLILKWRTFQDAALRATTLAAFVRRGVAAERIALRGASFHGEMLSEYGDIDIALGLPGLAAQDGDDYVRIAVALAGDRERLKALRDTLRERMRSSPLCDVAAFTRGLEDALVGLHARIANDAVNGISVV